MGCVVIVNEGDTEALRVALMTWEAFAAESEEDLKAAVDHALSVWNKQPLGLTIGGWIGPGMHAALARDAWLYAHGKYKRWVA